jgi:RNA polymerase sigma factor (TIGR02999 family)
MMPTHKITELLQAWNKGDSEALEELLPLVDNELKKIAHAYMRNEETRHLLQTTALLNEAMMRLLGQKIAWTSRRQFYALVARRMRQVLIDYARSRLASRRGHGTEHVDLSDAVTPLFEMSKELLQLDEALTRLAEIDERKAKIVEYRYFVGLTFDEVAQVLEISRSTVDREWRFARSWLKDEMTGDH